jgi:hypothetical protein
MTDKQPEALQVPLHELLEAIPEDWRIGVKDNDDWSAGTTWNPVGVMCHQAAAELRRLHEENEVLRRCLFQMQEAAKGHGLTAVAKATGEQQ